VAVIFVKKWDLAVVVIDPIHVACVRAKMLNGGQQMAKFYEVPVRWKDGTTTNGTGIGNNAAWQCKCGRILLGPHEGLYSIPQCTCKRNFRIVRGKRPQFVGRVEENIR
jgi:hypothetical protein